MGRIRFLIGTIVFAVVAATVAAQDSTEFEQPVLIGRGGNIRWSPNGTKVAYFTDDWLVVADTGNITQITRVGQFRWNNYCWASDSSFLGEEKYSNPPGTPWYGVTRMVEVYLNGTEREVARDSACFECPDDGKIGWPTRMRDGTAGYIREWIKPGKAGSFNPVESSRSPKGLSHWQTGRLTVLHERTGRLLPWEMGDICLVDSQGRLVRQITSGQLFFFPELASNGSTILASAAGGGIAILDTLGNVVWRPLENAITLPGGRYLAATSQTWAPDSRRVAYVLIEEDGHVGYGGDIHIADVRDSSIVRVTDTPDVEEHGISWWPDGTKILFTTRDGRLYSLEVE